MKRFYSILLGLGVFALTSGLFTACDSKDDSIDDPNLPGNSYFKINMLDTTYVRTENIEAYLRTDGTFELKLEGIPDNAAVLGFELKRFQEGTFPTNVNVMYYYPYINSVSDGGGTSLNIPGLYDFYLSQDMNDPKRNNGLIKVTKIDKLNKLISGTFNTRLLAGPLNELMNFPLSVDGEFKNIRYERESKNEDGTYIYAYVNDADINDFVLKSNDKGDIVDGRVTIIAESKYMRKRALEFSFPKEANVGKYEYDNVIVKFVSADGVVYNSDDKDENLVGSYLEITNITTVKANVKMYSGSFFYKVKDRDGHITEIKDGDFKALVNTKERITSPSIPGGGGGPIQI